MKVSVKKWGNSPAVRIPSSIMHAAHVRLDQVMNIHEEAGRIIIEPIQEAPLELSKLLEAINDQNMHGEVDFGEPVGHEV